MALFNKLFSSRKKNQCKYHDYICEKPFTFTNEQVRVVLFRECDFRGRKLLFDSHSVQKVPVLKNGEVEAKGEKYVEPANGYGYVFTKPKTDVGQLEEMIFGAVAMSFRGTSFKIHCLSSPSRLLCTQIFPSPRHPTRSRNSTTFSSTSDQSKLEDSGASSTNSISEQLSVNSTGSDTVLVCRGSPSIPLDVPTSEINGRLSPNNVDSGFNSWPHLLPSWDASKTFSCGSIYKRWLRSASTSLEHSGSSLTASASADECLTRPHNKSSKLGLSIIIELTAGQEKRLEQFLMEHIVFLEAMLWRARQGTEAAYIRHHSFASLMFEVVTSVTRWLVDLLSGPQLVMHKWISLFPVCDNLYSISSDLSGSRTNSFNISASLELKNDVSEILTDDFTFLNFTKLLKNEWDTVNKKRNYSEKHISAEKFIKELCELLESIDVKHTNFFMSTLITAVLTHHLGWVATVLPPNSDDRETISKFCNTCNPLWGQLADLYGATGHPTKVANTIITGNDKADLITKVLNSLTYFIRCNDVERRCMARVDVDKENEVVDRICQENSCIPEANYKKYEDHLREMEETNRIINKKYEENVKSEKSEEIEMRNFNGVVKTSRAEGSPKKFGMVRTQTCLTNLSCLNPKFGSDEAEPAAKALCTEKFNLAAPPENGVIFVLGENEQLIGLKKDKSEIQKKRPTSLNLKSSFYHKSSDSSIEEEMENSIFKDEDFTSEITDVKPSTSWTTSQLKLQSESKPDKEFNRSQSVPPEKSDPECKKKEIKSKYRYSGVKFNFQQYPQIVTNYMKSKNLEMSQLPFAEKALKLNRSISTFGDCSSFDFTNCDDDTEEVEALQTPSNASELEFTSDLVTDKYEAVRAKEKVERKPKIFVRTHIPNTVVKEINCEGLKKSPIEHPLKINETSNNAMFERDETDQETCEKENSKRMQIIELPLPKMAMATLPSHPISYTSSLMRGVGEHYISDMVLQGTSEPKIEWESSLRRDLALATRHPLLDQPVDEAVAIVANTDTWEVHLMSSHTYVVDRGSSGVRVGMSQLVANMLESLLHMWRVRTPPEYCLMHIENRLQEFCLLSKALSQLLLATEFCSMEFLTSTLQLEVNDVPLLMAVASTHSPQVTQKYGLSFQ